LIFLQFVEIGLLSAVGNQRCRVVVLLLGGSDQGTLRKGRGMARKVSKAVAGLAALLSVGVAAGAANAAVSSSTVAATAAPAWHSVGQKGFGGQITAVTAVTHAGKTAEFAFNSTAEANGTGKWSMFARSGTEDFAFYAVSIAEAGEIVTAAKAISATDVLAFTSFPGGGRVLRFNGGNSWTVLKTFSAAIGSATVLNAGNVWVFGSLGSVPTSQLGVWHFDGHTWTKLASTLKGGSATSATNAWAFTGTTIAHFNGKEWTATNVAGLLPAADIFHSPQLVSVYATNNLTAYAVGTGNAQDAGGPVVLLQYNGHAWSKVAEYGSGNPGQEELATDGHGGVWLPVHGESGSSPVMLHYANGSGKFVQAALPGLTGVPLAGISSIANVPDTTQELAGGYIVSTHSPYISEIYAYN
jgi:hypothetical protein